ncbi:MAG: RNA-binding domain-containing protein [Candidatus Bathyarchaeales archaeon]
MDEVTVYIEAEVNPTESEEKVKRAVENVFGNVQTKIQPVHKGALLIAEAKGLEALTKLYNLLRRERIRDAARGALFDGLSGKTISFCLNKQVAYAGHVSFSKEVAESPLGPIKVRIECEDPKRLIDWLAPKTA